MTIQELRRKIDKIDRELVRLLGRRAQLSLAVGRLKKATGRPLFHREREREIAGNVRRANQGPLPGHAVQRLFEEILRVTRATVRESLRPQRPRRRKTG